MEAELNVNFANLYRYGLDLKDPEKAVEYYNRAELIVNQIKGNDDLKHYHLSRIYLGYAKIAEERGKIDRASKEYWPAELLAQAEDYFTKIVRKYKYANQQLDNELRINHSTLSSGYTNPRVAVENTFFTDDLGNKKMRLRLSVDEPFLLHFTPQSTQEIAALLDLVTDTDLNAGSAQETLNLGGRFKPWHWLSTEARFRLATGPSTHADGINISPFINPDVTLALGARWPQDDYILRGLSATAVANLYWKYPDLTSVYGNVFYNAGRDINNPFLQGASAGAEINYFRFPYGDNLPIRLRINFPSIKYELDLKEFDTGDTNWWFHGMLRAGLSAAFIYEWARDYSSYSTMNNGADVTTRVKALEKDNLGFMARAYGNINLWGWTTLMPYFQWELARSDVRNLYPASFDNPDKVTNNYTFGLNLSLTGSRNLDELLQKWRNGIGEILDGN